MTRCFVFQVLDRVTWFGVGGEGLATGGHCGGPEPWSGTPTICIWFSSGSHLVSLSGALLPR
jgi:hypothetical protein